MSDFSSSSSCSKITMFAVPAAVASGSSSTGASDDVFEDACSICLEPFTSDDPATVTSCKHEYHLQCILEWSQRSKECPICWRLIVLKDPTSQELLVAVETERAARSSNVITASSESFHHFQEDLDTENDASFSDDSDFDELIIHRLAFAANRAHYLGRRERHRSSGHGPSQVLAYPSPENVPDVRQINTISPEISPNLSYGSIERDSPIADMSSSNIQSPSVSNSPEQPQQQSPSSLSLLFKSKITAASARYKESISRGTLGFKEKLGARNISVKELSKGVQREITAGFAGVARMMERLDLTPKQTSPSTPASSCDGATSNFLKGKGVQETVNTQSDSKSSADIVCSIPGQLEVSIAKDGH